MSRWSLEFASGSTLVLRSGVTVIGRSSACDVVLDNPRISRQQLLVLPRAEGVELINVGRQQVTSADDAIDPEHLARDGDPIEIGGTLLAFVRAWRPATAEFRWLVRVDEGPAVKLTHTPFLLGGGDDDDDLRIEGWPRSALRLHEVGPVLIATLECDPDQVLDPEADPSFDADGFARLHDGSRLSLGGVTLEVRSLAETLDQSTHLDGEDGGPRLVRLEPYSRGGILHVHDRHAQHSVYLAGRRFALMRALLAPEPPTLAGELVSVEQLCRAIWPGDPAKDETDFNVLIYRLRRDLVNAGLDVDAVIERARGTGMVRAPIALGAKLRFD